MGWGGDGLRWGATVHAKAFSVTLIVASALRISSPEMFRSRMHGLEFSQVLFVLRAKAQASVNGKVTFVSFSAHRFQHQEEYLRRVLV